MNSKFTDEMLEEEIKKNNFWILVNKVTILMQVVLLVLFFVTK